MKILFTDHGFNLLGGAERAARELALALHARGHSVLAFSAPIGQQMRVAASAGIKVAWDLAKRDFQPDILHCQHHLDAMVAITGLPDLPAIYHCHGGEFLDAPPLHPRIYRYVTITETLAARMAIERNIAPSSIDVFLNWVDVRRFATVRQPAAKPRRALAYGNKIRPTGVLAVVDDAATACGLDLDRIGRRIGQEIENPEQVLPLYDIVFASGKSAIDALASGCAVIILGLQGCGEMVREENFERLRKANFNIPVNFPPPSAERIAEEILRYDPDVAAAVTRRLRREADLDLVVDRMTGVYHNVIEAHAHAQPRGLPAQRSTMDYLRTLVPVAKGLDNEAGGGLSQPLLRSRASGAARLQITALRTDLSKL